MPVPLLTRGAVKFLQVPSDGSKSQSQLQAWPWVIMIACFLGTTLLFCVFLFIVWTLRMRARVHELHEVRPPGHVANHLHLDLCICSSWSCGALDPSDTSGPD